ncbi:TIGR01777 family oxidoreductase [Weeksellaceae bacterium KMM 9713]|uniref:TIGR01777 family oxidoreductase n=1 Tax=Profundicola chukchiensis TaxID=2961959 RepID=A0A9X4MW23_9FLAO|nr:TIGR01777 family oxidoreductase [Profundicola chukchiensis]MDG4945936.1 TIGR01777 family oxidoreductase [Profundicola chukchiensis]
MKNEQNSAMKKMVLSGGTGYLGSLIQDYFKNEYEIYILTRSERESKGNIHFVQWDSKNLGDWTNVLENADVLINLAGMNINTRFTEENKKKLLSSRINSTEALGKAIEQCEVPPKMWLNASSAAIYEESIEVARTEDDTTRDDDFLSFLSQKWEEAFYKYANDKTNKTVFRISLILGESEESALHMLKKLVKLGGGGAAGSGDQMVSWMGEKDLPRALDFIIKNQLTGAFNFSNGNVLSNADFMKELRKKYKMPIGLPAPEFLINIGTKIIGTSSDLVLRSQNIAPKNLKEAGFKFEQLQLSDI